MIKIVADDKIPFLKGALEPFASVTYMDGKEISRLAVNDADALLVRTRTRCDESLLKGSKVKFIATATIGFDHIDAAYCHENGISWVNVPGCNAGSVLQYIASVFAGLVIRNDLSLAGKTLGIIGVGHVGKKVEQLAHLLGFKVLLNDPPRARKEGGAEFVPIETVLAESDFITLHVPLSRSGEDPTFHLMNDLSFSRMKEGAWLFNTSRGEVVDGNALKRALATGSLAGAVLDVWENEPLIDRQLLKIIDIATPHIAGYSTDGKRNGTAGVVRALGAFFNLPVTDWEPSGMPEPEAPSITVDCLGQPDERVISRVILHTYDAMADDASFRPNPENFEKLRGGYPVRREFPAFQINLRNCSAHIRELLLTLGFTEGERF
jgi:erythronate-4-phosphate dehydrogenase